MADQREATTAAWAMREHGAAAIRASGDIGTAWPDGLPALVLTARPGGPPVILYPPDSPCPCHAVAEALGGGVA